MDQTVIASKNICAQRNGPKAVDLVKSTETGCPTGYKACSSQTTNWWDRVCIENAKDIQTDCPILSVQFTPIQQVAGLGSSWKFQQFSNSYAVTYTKTQGTEGPLVITSLSRDVCLDPQDVLRFDVDDYLYPLEKDQGVEKCTIDLEGAPVIDPRYRKMGNYQISQYDLQLENGVLDKLRSLKEYTKFVPDVNVKKTLLYDFWERAPAKWICSKEKQLEAMDKMRTTSATDKGDDMLRASFIVCIVYVAGILIPTILICCLIVKCRQHCCLKTTVWIQLGLEIALSLVCMILAFVSVSQYEEYSKQLTGLDDAVNGCMEEYSDVPDDVRQAQLIDPVDEGKTAANMLAIFAATVLLKIIIVLVLACIIQCGSRK